MAGAAFQIGPMCRGFFRWWLGELAGFLRPLSQRFAVAGHPEQVILDVSGAEAILLRCQRGACVEAGRWPLTQLAQVLPAHLAGDGRHIQVLRLSGAKALKKVLSLPIGAEPDLDSVLVHQVDQHTPFAADEVALGWRVLDRDFAAARISVEMTVVPRQLIDDALSSARGWGFTPRVVDVADTDAFRPAVINLLVQDQKDPEVFGRRRVSQLLTVIALILAVAAVFIPLEQRSNRIEALAVELKALSARSRDVLDLRDRADILAKRVALLEGRKSAGPRALRVIDELTRVMPKNSWIYEFRIDGNEVLISGYSPSAAALIGFINASPLFGAPRFRSSVSRVGDGDKERFNLSFSLTALSTEPGSGPEK